MLAPQLTDHTRHGVPPLDGKFSSNLVHVDVTHRLVTDLDTEGGAHHSSRHTPTTPPTDGVGGDFSHHARSEHACASARADSDVRSDGKG